MFVKMLLGSRKTVSRSVSTIFLRMSRSRSEPTGSCARVDDHHPLSARLERGEHMQYPLPVGSGVGGLPSILCSNRNPIHQTAPHALPDYLLCGLRFRQAGFPGAHAALVSFVVACVCQQVINVVLAVEPPFLATAILFD